MWSKSLENAKKEFLFSKIEGLKPTTLLKIKLVHWYFSFVISADVEQLFCRTA